MAQDEGGVLVGAVLGGRERVEGGVQGAADTEVVVVEEVQPAVGAASRAASASGVRARRAARRAATTRSARGAGR